MAASVLLPFTSVLFYWLASWLGKLHVHRIHGRARSMNTCAGKLVSTMATGDSINPAKNRGNYDSIVVRMTC
jgi:hypothetical protein